MTPENRKKIKKVEKNHKMSAGNQNFEPIYNLKDNAI